MKDIDRRYSYVRAVYHQGELNSFTAIFEIIPKGVVAADLGLNPHVFAEKIASLWDLSFRVIVSIAERTGLTADTLAGLVLKELEARRSEQSKDLPETTGPHGKYAQATKKSDRLNSVTFGILKKMAGGNEWLFNSLVNLVIRQLEWGQSTRSTPVALLPGEGPRVHPPSMAEKIHPLEKLADLYVHHQG